MSNKDYLSQEEIDALLNASAVSDDQADGDSNSGSGSESVTVDDYLTSLEQDALGEIGNITFGSAATALSTLLGKKVDITTPTVTVVEKDKLEAEFPKPHVAVHVNYVDGFEGANLLVIQKRDAQVIANLMLGGDGMITEEDELTEIHISAVQEAMNQMMGSSATSMSTIFNRMVNISPPGIDILDLTQGEGETRLPDEKVYVQISFRLKIEDLIDSNIMQLLTVPFAKNMVVSLMGGGEEVQEEAVEAEEPSVQAEQNVPTPPSAPSQPPAAAQAPPAPEQPAPQQPMGTPPQPNPYGGQQPPQQPPYMQPPAAQGYPDMYGQPAPGHYPPPMGYPQGGGMPQQPNRNVNVQPVEYAQFQGSGMQGASSNLDLLMDIPLKVTVELGRTTRQIKDILDLSQGSILELDKLAGEPVDILVNNKLVAKGEVVVIDENFGVRVTDIVSQLDRIKNLQ
ncbi:flagellar motor switch phosphatase FliY [Marinicrinis sediminis]|uniref:Flagellar motor switch phosphatase FliY n=1 Tax=Marinicrinis sediminis TaxID=1652465 RepID=A0ABW5R504_9BACL